MLSKKVNQRGAKKSPASSGYFLLMSVACIHEIENELVIFIETVIQSLECKIVLQMRYKYLLDDTQLGAWHRNDHLSQICCKQTLWS